MSTGIAFSMSANPFASADFSASAGSIVPSPSTGSLLPIVLNMTKPFYIRKPVTSADNTTVAKILKGKI